MSEEEKKLLLDELNREKLQYMELFNENEELKKKYETLKVEHEQTSEKNMRTMCEEALQQERKLLEEERKNHTATLRQLEEKKIELELDNNVIDSLNRSLPLQKSLPLAIGNAALTCLPYVYLSSFVLPS
jgi:hypothetical protein